MKILIVDDETPARQHMVNTIKKLNSSHYLVVAEASNGQEAIEICQKQPIDLVLMDIRMPGMDGIDAAKRLNELTVSPAVIFTTAYEQHALEAFSVHADGYLLKPIRKEKLLLALENASRLNLSQLESVTNIPDEFIPVQIHGNLKRIMLDDVIYFHADQKYVNIVHKKGGALTEESLKSLTLKYAHKFIRIHRNALVAKSQLMGVSKTIDGQHYALLSNAKYKLEISRRHLAQVKSWVKG